MRLVYFPLDWLGPIALRIANADVGLSNNKVIINNAVWCPKWPHRHKTRARHRGECGRVYES